MSEDTFKLVWEVADGYVSSGRPQDLELWLCDLAAYDSEEEVREAIEQMVQEDFQTRVAHVINNLDKAVAAVMAHKAKIAEDDKE